MGLRRHGELLEEEQPEDGDPLPRDEGRGLRGRTRWKAGHSLQCAELLRPDGEQGCIYPNRPEDPDQQVHQFQARGTPSFEAYAVCQPHAWEPDGVRVGVRLGLGIDVLAHRSRDGVVPLAAPLLRLMTLARRFLEVVGLASRFFSRTDRQLNVHLLGSCVYLRYAGRLSVVLRRPPE